MAADWNELAVAIEQARAGGYLMDPLRNDQVPQNAADCYFVQDRAIALSCAAPLAWKLGAPALAAQAGMGLSEPFSGPILPGMLLESPAQIDTSGFSCHKFEPEVAITLGQDITGPISLDEARAAIASYHPAIEIINFRSSGGASLGAMGMIADFGANGALVLGAAMPEPATDYQAMVLEVRINSAPAAARTPPPPETDPAQLLAWFSGHMAARGYALKAGDVITTGSQAGMLAYAPGDLIEADFGPAGIASIQC